MIDCSAVGRIDENQRQLISSPSSEQIEEEEEEEETVCGGVRSVWSPSSATLVFFFFFQYSGNYIHAINENSAFLPKRSEQKRKETNTMKDYCGVSTGFPGFRTDMVSDRIPGCPELKGCWTGVLELASSTGFRRPN